MNVHTSFLALTQDEIDAHVDELVNEHIDGPERSRVLAYLNQTLAKDRIKVRQYRRVLARKSGRCLRERTHRLCKAHEPVYSRLVGPLHPHEGEAPGGRLGRARAFRAGGHPDARDQRG